MSLRVKIREQAKTYEDYAKEFIELCHSKAGWDVRANYKQQKLVSVDVVSDLLDKAIVEIKQEVAVENWAWFFYSKLGYRITDSDEDKELLKKAMIGLFDKSLAILGVEGETKK